MILLSCFNELIFRICTWVQIVYIVHLIYTISATFVDVDISKSYKNGILGYSIVKKRDTRVAVVVLRQNPNNAYLTKMTLTFEKDFDLLKGKTKKQLIFVMHFILVPWFLTFIANCLYLLYYHYFKINYFLKKECLLANIYGGNMKIHEKNVILSHSN